MEIARQIICRACTLPRAAELAECWDTLLEMVAASSPVLWEKLKGISPGQLNKLNARTQWSVLRYFNRAKFRPIPYGKFASVGVMLPSDINKDFILNKQVGTVSIPDWTAAASLAVAAASLGEERFWRVQSTLYTEDGNHYFFQSTEGQTELFCVQGFSELDKLLEFCAVERTTAEIRVFAKEDWDFFSGMLAQLTELQVLVHSDMPNVTGKDYFERMEVNKAVISAEAYEISFRHGTGMIDQSLETQLLDYAQFARKHFPNPQITDLSEFKKAFSLRYENQWQALAQVLDPSRGLGYAGLSNTDEAALEELLPKPMMSQPMLEMDALNRFLMAKMLFREAIDLKDFKETLNDEALLPNTMSVLLQKADDDRWVLDHMGGATANALLGRFAFNEQIGVIAQELAQLEQEANPEVLFFDVAYQTGERTDNINRRPQLYHLELSLGGWSTHANQLQLSDIFINVVNGELILYSARHGCRLVPRMASAYNTMRSSHPLLRLLSDLQYQNLHCQFHLELSQRFPQMNYYPELRYGALVIQPAKWLVPNEAKKSVLTLEKWLAESQVNRFLRIGNADQYLCLDIQSDTDRQLLLNALQRDDSLKYLSAWLSGTDSGILDTAGKRYAYQLQLNIVHRLQVYEPVAKFEMPLPKQVWHLGDEWFFVSFYVVAAMQPSVLLELINPLVKRYKAWFDSWFYVLYRDPEQHIRLRLKWKPTVTSAERWKIYDEIGNWLGSCGIRDMNVRPYVPERQRYGYKTMALAENFFSIDSEEALTEMALSEEEREQCCYVWIRNFVDLALPNLALRMRFLEKMSAMFSQEMGWGHLQFKLINQTWREISNTETTTLVSESIQRAWNGIAAITPFEKREQLLADLIHMHVNRRFANHARLREAKLYQYVLLHLRKVLKFALKEQVSVR